LADSIAALADVSIREFCFGEHREADFREADLLIVNPAVKPDNPLVRLARDSGARIASEIELFLDRCPAPVIGVTGSNGKSTTAAMTAAILNAAGRRTWLGGNIGRSLLPDLPQIRADDWAVLELSSFQLHWLSDQVRWPRIAVITNFAPNHLDWHGTVEHYTRAKQRLLAGKSDDCVAVFDDLDSALANWKPLVVDEWHGPVDDTLLPPLRIPGRHNRTNASLAASAALVAGAERSHVERGLSEFAGLPHRLQLVAEIAGRRFCNDSKATTPEAAMAALTAMEWPTWILLGGSDKQVDLTPLVRYVGEHAHGAALYGAVGGTLDALFAEHAPHLPRLRCNLLDEAFAWCWLQSSLGEAILLSPACASLDQFSDFAARGQQFERLVRRLGTSSPA
jgi:UDP-N-acetylmuramoylalanine--D-glutamate ligase